MRLCRASECPPDNRSSLDDLAHGPSSDPITIASLLVTSEIVDRNVARPAPARRSSRPAFFRSSRARATLPHRAIFRCIHAPRRLDRRRGHPPYDLRDHDIAHTRASAEAQDRRRGWRIGTPSTMRMIGLAFEHVLELDVWYRAPPPRSPDARVAPAVARNLASRQGDCPPAMRTRSISSFDALSRRRCHVEGANGAGARAARSSRRPRCRHQVGARLLVMLGMSRGWGLDRPRAYGRGAAIIAPMGSRRSSRNLARLCHRDFHAEKC